MARKNHYKKIFVIAAALFILFAPVGLTANTASTAMLSSSMQAGVGNSRSLPTPSFALRLSFNLAEASDTATVGGGAGVTQITKPNWLDCLKSPATCGVFYVSLTVNGAMGLLLALGAWLVRLGLQFNDNVFNSPAVLTGFSVSLAIANLGFVLGIIIIAIATIIRNQTYGIKQLLWKLVIMAILVNFGLVITAPIVGFANSMSNYFINATSPSAATGGYEGYIQTMMTAFSPQTQQLGGAITNSGSGNSFIDFCKGNWSWISEVQDMCNSAGVTTDSSDSFWQTTIALLFDIVFSALTAFTFLCLAVLLIIRYLMLGGLLIVLPLAWLTYVFPKFDNSYSKWWNTFIKWTFFPPLALFFIYLAFITAANTPKNQLYLGSALAVPTGAKTGVENTLETQTGLGEGVVQQAADEILLVGLTIMGLMFASTLAGKAGSVAVNMGTSGANMAGGFIAKRTKKTARAGFNAMGGRDLVKSMRTGAIVPQKLRDVPLVGRPLNWAAQKATGAAGRAIEPALNNREYVEEAKKRVPKNPEEIKENLRNVALPMEDKFAHLASLIDSKDLDDKVVVGSQSATDFLDSHKAEVKNYAFEKSSNDANKALGSDKDMRDAAKKLKAAGTDVAAAAAAMSELDDATKTFVEKLKKGDVAKMNSNDALGQDNELSRALARGFFNHAPHLVSSALPTMKGPALKTFEKIYTAAGAGEARKAAGNATRLQQVTDQMDSFKQSLANNALFSAMDPSQTPAPTPTQNP